MCLKRLITLTLCCCVSLGFANAQEEKDTVRNYSYNYDFRYPVGRDILTRDLADNNSQFAKLLSVLNSNERTSIDTIMFYGIASPEGRPDLNFELAFNRAYKFRELIYSRRPNVYNVSTYLDAATATWREVTEIIEQDPNFPNRSEILTIFRHTNPQNALRVIKSIYPESHKYILDVTFPYFRSVCVSVILSVDPKEQHQIRRDKFQPYPMPIVRDEDEEIPVLENIAPPTIASSASSVATPAQSAESQDYDMPFEPVYTLTRKPLFALKTNLLFDAVAAVNLEIEVPFAKRWSIALEAVFPWWLERDKQYAMQIVNVNLELRHWFGNRENRKAMTGWFMGAYGGLGYYDLEIGTQGYQGEFWMAGISGGFAHTINKSGTLRMEYSVGVGYMRTDYREYVPRFGVDNEWHLIRRETAKLNFVGPTRAKVSLVWMLNFNKKNRVY